MPPPPSPEQSLSSQDKMIFRDKTNKKQSKQTKTSDYQTWKYDGMKQSYVPLKKKKKKKRHILHGLSH